MGGRYYWGLVTIGVIATFEGSLIWGLVTCGGIVTFGGSLLWGSFLMGGLLLSEGSLLWGVVHFRSSTVFQKTLRDLQNAISCKASWESCILL